MISNDEKEKERVDARNALEEYVYDMREKLSEEGQLSTYIENNQRQNICQQLNDLENWLYEDGEDCENEIYRSKLSDLHKQTDPIKARVLSMKINRMHLMIWVMLYKWPVNQSTNSERIPSNMIT